MVQQIENRRIKVNKAWIICTIVMLCIFEGIIFSFPRLITKEVYVDIYSNEWNEDSQTHLYWDDGTGLNYENKIVAEISGTRARLVIPLDVIDHATLFRLDPISEEKDITIDSFVVNGKKIELNDLSSWVVAWNQCESKIQNQMDSTQLKLSVSGNDPFLYFDENFNNCLKMSMNTMTFERWKWVGFGVPFAIAFYFIPYWLRRFINDCKKSDAVQNAKMKNTNLDLVRIFATIMVLSVHVGIYVGFDFSVGSWGVQLFFILSGYLAFASLDRNPATLEYYKKRAVRIIPTYWICLILIYLEDLCFELQSTSIANAFSGQCGPKFLRYFFFLQCMTPSEKWELWNNHSALWSMSSFAVFYILAPWLYRIMKKFYPGLVILLAFLYFRPHMVYWIEQACSSYSWEARIQYFACMNPLVEMYCFLFGAVLFVAIKEHKESIYLVLGLMFFIVTSMENYPYEFIFVILIACAVKAEALFKNERIVKVISAISAGSFTLYLIHFPILQIEGLIWEKLGIESKLLHGIYIYSLCIAGAYILYFMVICKVEKRVKEIFLKNN
ncbi:MAG: acyltransferase family protein [Lachnospiraceae bacterium]